MINLSEFRSTRNLARAYRASVARQTTAPTQWRENGLEELTRELARHMGEWHARGQVRVYERAVSPAWDWR